MQGIDNGISGTAIASEWPWHAALLEMPLDLYICGAVLIRSNWLLTAAHCVEEYATNNKISLKVNYTN